MPLASSSPLRVYLPHALVAALPLLVCACATRPAASALPATTPVSSTAAPGATLTWPELATPLPPFGTDALPRWRPHFDALIQTVAAIEEPLNPAESADAPLPSIPESQLAPALAALAPFTLAPGESLQLPTIHGPESPFPDHQPLRQIASLRTLAARLALAADDTPAALALVRQNLAQARATLRAQAGLIPLIHATGVWQAALDGAHALARSPTLPPAEARALLAELQADSGLAQHALERALRGEYAHVFRVVVERLPRTDDPDLALSAVGSLGMAEPEPLPPGALGLGLTAHPLLDTHATLAAYRADLAPYLQHLAHSSRFPRGLYATTTGPTLANYLHQLGAFHEYATGESEPTLDLLLRARAAMESTPNPVGKLLAAYLTPVWQAFFINTLRREAQRSAVCGLLAWRLHGRPAPWPEIVAAGLLPAPPADPFSDDALHLDLGPPARIWSVFLNATDDGGAPVEGNNGQPADLVWLW